MLLPGFWFPLKTPNGEIPTPQENAQPHFSPDVWFRAHTSLVLRHENGLSNAVEPCSNGWTPLCYAVLNGSPLLVSALLDARANPHDSLKKTKARGKPKLSKLQVAQVP